MKELLTGTWAMQPDGFRRLEAMLSRGVKSEGLSLGRGNSRSGKVAIVPIHGVISQRGHAMLDAFGIAQTSTESLIARLRALAESPAVDTIVLDIDSPGGSVGGVPEAAEAIHSLRDKKRIVAISNSLAASAAYWIGAAAQEFYVTPSSETGSIGVFTVHHDFSRMLDREGETVTLIHAGKYKVEGNMYQPLGSDAEAFTQQSVDGYYEMFLSDISRFRGTTQIATTDAGQGRTVSASQAVSDGLADGIATLDSLTSGNTLPRGKTAMTESTTVMTERTMTDKTQVSEWDRLSAEERAEFGNDSAAWEAYRKANAAGLVRQTARKAGVWKARVPAGG